MSNYYDERKFFIWGTGYQANQMNQFYGAVLDKINLIGYIDNDSNKKGQMFNGKKIYGPEILQNIQDGYLIIVNRFYMDILNQIDKEYPWYKERIVNEYFWERLLLISRYENEEDAEIQEVVTYIRKHHPLGVFNYDFISKYQPNDYLVEYDEEKKLFYVMFHNKKMYFPSTYKTEERVREYYNSVCLEQDENSPHKYLNDKFYVKKGDVVIDAGVAEGNFSLSIIDDVKKIYLFEPDNDWVEALKYTFEPYKDKVEIINKCVSNYINDSTTTIDHEIKEEINFIKMDVEGEECYALFGAEQTIKKSKNIQCVVCTYHQEFAYEGIKTILDKMKFKTEPSKGYMWYPSDYNPMRPPVLRRGLIRGKKEDRYEN